MNLKLAFIIAFLFFPYFASAQKDEGAKYVGYEYKGVVPDADLPNGVKNLGGGLIGDIDADPVYEIAEVEKGRTKMLWLNVSTGRDSNGVTGWKVLDVISFPALTKSDYLFFYGDPGIECRLKGADVANLVGIGRIVQRKGIFQPSKLWVANINAKKFEPTPVAGMKCVYSEP